jgi:DNA-binding NtrC family response regulator
MAMRYLVCWIGNTDLRAAEGKEPGGPVAQAVEARSFDRIVLLSDHPKAHAEAYCGWLRERTSVPIQLEPRKLTGPTEFGEIYSAVVDVLSSLMRTGGKDLQFTFHLSPGTSQMAAIWIIVSKTRFPAELIESSREHGVRTASVPFDISADFIPDLLRKPDENLERAAQGLPDETPGFESILHRSPIMKKVISQARRVAVRSIPILLEGESGTGKELMARAIHRASLRRDRPFVAVNCGAIPADLVESEFFGHVKGAFTGAAKDRAGHFESAKGGTLFLDEIGELPKPTQVKLLRVLQEQEVTRLGSSEPIKVDVRVIAATNRDLSGEVSAGNFREDLFYRLAVAVLRLPPLRERQGDLSPLIDALLARVNRDARDEPGYREKRLSARAKNFMLQHRWPGNVRELINTLHRAAIWCERDVIDLDDMKAATLESGPGAVELERGLGRPIEQGFDLQELIAEIARHYLRRALDASNGSKTQTAKLLGFASYQTVSNWLKRYDIRS